jgi:WD40 repeat protein
MVRVYMIYRLINKGISSNKIAFYFLILTTQQPNQLLVFRNVVDAYTGHMVLKVNGHTGIVNCLRSTADGRVCTGSDDHQILVWNVELPRFW